MNPKTRSFCKLSFFVAAFGLVMISSVMMTGQPAAQRSPHHVGLPDDWSHHHLIFSNPGTYEQVIANGTYSKWINLRYDTRFILQQIKRNYAATGVASPEVMTAVETQASVLAKKPPPPPKVTLKKDWSMNMGSGAKVGAGQYPAKYTFSPTATPDCTNDFVAFNTSLPGGSSQSSIVAYNNLYTSGTSPLCSGGGPKVDWAYNTGGTISTSVVLSGDGSQLAFVHTPTSGTASLVLLKWHANTTGRTVTGSLSAGSPHVTITSGTFTQADVGAQISGTGIPAGDTIASFLSSTTVNLATAPTAHASETLTITAEAAATPGVPPTVSNSAYRACTAPCMTTLTFSGSHNDTNSAPFYDYLNNIIYVGDDSGSLHKFTGVFSGTPGEATSPWPVAVSGAKLTSPVYDSASGNVFVADSGGFLYSYPAAGGSVVHTSQLAVTGSTGIVDAPLVDSATSTVYVWVGDDGNTSTSRNCVNATGCNGVFRFSTSLGSTSGTGLCSSTNGTSWTSGTVCGSESVFGVGTTSTRLYDGSFDNTYYIGTGNTGNLWSCGANATPAPKLVASPMSTFSTTTISIATNIVNPLASGAATGSPVTEIYNGITDYIFLSMTANGNQTSVCTGACVYGFTLSTIPSASLSAGLAAAGGASGIVIDNVSTSTGASQVYFSTLGNQSCTGGTGGCAVQAAQSNLH